MFWSRGFCLVLIKFGTYLKQMCVWGKGVSMYAILVNSLGLLQRPEINLVIAAVNMCKVKSHKIDELRAIGKLICNLPVNKNTEVFFFILPTYLLYNKYLNWNPVALLSWDNGLINDKYLSDWVGIPKYKGFFFSWICLKTVKISQGLQHLRCLGKTTKLCTCSLEVIHIKGKNV